MISCPGVVTMVVQPHQYRAGYALMPISSSRLSGTRSSAHRIVVTREMVRAMKPRSVIMDISIDEGGCVETSRPTTHENPTFIEEGVIHYCVPNMPSVVARTATMPFSMRPMPFIQELANKGIEPAIDEQSGDRTRASNTHKDKSVIFPG